MPTKSMSVSPLTVPLQVKVEVSDDCDCTTARRYVELPLKFSVPVIVLLPSTTSVETLFAVDAFHVSDAYVFEPYRVLLPEGRAIAPYVLFRPPVNVELVWPLNTMLALAALTTMFVLKPMFHPTLPPSTMLIVLVPRLTVLAVVPVHEKPAVVIVKLFVLNVPLTTFTCDAIPLRFTRKSLARLNVPLWQVRT